jgi:hypothetical protein
MTHAEIVATYSDTALDGIVKQLATARGEWAEQRYAAAQAEIRNRTTQNLQKQL